MNILLGKTKLSLDGKCPKCGKKGDFECHQLELDGWDYYGTWKEFGYKITCNKCKSVFHEIYTFDHWEQVND